MPSSDAELPPFFVGVPPAAPLTTSAAVLPAPVASTPTVGPRYGWKCDMCKKLKSLSGSHLEGKTEVRSECWPCAKKTLFRRVELAEGEDAGAPAQGSTQTNSAAAAAAAVTPPKERTVKPAEATKSEIVGPKPGDAPKDGPFKSAFGTAKPPTEEKQPVTAAAPKPAEAPKSAFGAAKPADAPKAHSRAHLMRRRSPFKSAGPARPLQLRNLRGEHFKSAEASLSRPRGQARSRAAFAEVPAKQARRAPSTEPLPQRRAPKASPFKSAFGGSKPGDAPKAEPVQERIRDCEAVNRGQATRLPQPRNLLRLRRQARSRARSAQPSRLKEPRQVAHRRLNQPSRGELVRSRRASSFPLRCRQAMLSYHHSLLVFLLLLH